MRCAVKMLMSCLILLGFGCGSQASTSSGGTSLAERHELSASGTMKFLVWRTPLPSGT